MRIFGLALVGLTALALSTTASAQSVGIGSGPDASLTHRLASAVAKVVADNSDLQTRALPHTSNALHVPLVDKGQVAFGLNSTGDLNDAIPGKRQFEGKAASNLRFATRLVSFPVGVFVRKDSGIMTMKDLEGRTMPAGYAAQLTVLDIVNGLLANGGVDASKIKEIPVPNTTAGAELLTQGKVDGTYSSLGGARLKKAEADLNGIRILAQTDTPEAVKAMQEHYPNSFLMELPAGTPGTDGPTKVMGFDMFLMTSTHASDEVVYNAVKALAENKDGLVAISPVFNGFDPTKMATKYEGGEYHPGAIKFYQEAGQWPPSS